MLELHNEHRTRKRRVHQFYASSVAEFAASLRTRKRGGRRRSVSGSRSPGEPSGFLAGFPGPGAFRPLSRGPRRAGSRHTPSLPAGGDWPSGGILLMLLGFHAPAALPPCRGQSPGSEAGNASDGHEKRGIPRPRSRSTRLFHVERKPSPGHGPRTGQGQGNIPAALGADAAHEPPAIAITLPGLSSAGGSGARGRFWGPGAEPRASTQARGVGGGRDFDDPPADVNFLWFICLFSF